LRFYLLSGEKTSGLNTTTEDIISLGAVAFIYQMSNKLSEIGKTTQVVLGEFHEYIHTNKTITSEHIHHISAAKLKAENAQPFASVIQKFQNWLRSFNKPCILIAHNGRHFDDRILYCNMINHDPPIPFIQWMNDSRVYGFIDSLVLFKTNKQHFKEPIRHPTTKVPSLTLNIIHLCWCGFTMPDHHNALADAQALARIFTTPQFKSYFNTSKLIQSVTTVQNTWKSLNQQTGIETKRKLDEEAQIEQERKRQKVLVFTDQYVGNENWKCCTKCITFLSTLDPHTCPE
jgi:DNA polymerase III epsilon subunit-like protein